MAPERNGHSTIVAPRPAAYTLLPKSEAMERDSGSHVNKWRALPPVRRIEPAQQNSLQKQASHSPATPTAPTSNRRDYVAWSKRETEALVRWLDTHDNFNAMKRNTARMLPMLAEHLQAQISGCTKTAKQCDHKIRNLKKCYKKVKEKLSSSGAVDGFDNATPTWQEDILDQFPYFREFERIMADEHIVRPAIRPLTKASADIATPQTPLLETEAVRTYEEDNNRETSQSISPSTTHQDEDTQNDIQNENGTGINQSFSPPSEHEFNDMARFRSIRPKEGNPPRQCPVAHHQPKPVHSTSPRGTNSHNHIHNPPVKHDNSFILPEQLRSRIMPSRHSAPEMSPDDQPDFKKQRLMSSSVPSFVSPYAQMINVNEPGNMFSANGSDYAVSKCPIKMDLADTGLKCPMGMEGTTGASLFGSNGGGFSSAALASLSQVTSKHGSAPTVPSSAGTDSTTDAQGTSGTVDENNPHGTLLNILKMMSRNPNSSTNASRTSQEPSSSSARADVPHGEGSDANSNDDSNPQETAQILAEHIKSSLAKKEAVNRQKLYLNHLQSQIQRHTMRAGMLYNNGQVDRASKVMDKIDELELELHEVLSRPLTQF